MTKHGDASDKKPNWEKCTSQNPFDRGMCYGLITGYYEGMQRAYTCSTNPNVTRRQIKDVVVKFLQDNPAERHLPAAVLSWRALNVAFGCKKN